MTKPASMKTRWCQKPCAICGAVGLVSRGKPGVINTLYVCEMCEPDTCALNEAYIRVQRNERKQLRAEEARKVELEHFKTAVELLRIRIADLEGLVQQKEHPTRAARQDVTSTAARVSNHAAVLDWIDVDS